MSDELTELLDTAIYKEIASQAFYIAGQKTTMDQGAKTLMKELAEEEFKHAQLLKDAEEKGIAQRGWHQDAVSSLGISEYLTSGETLKSASLQETLTIAMKREQQSIEFYSKLMSVMKDEEAKRLCEKLVHFELRHKIRLELFYDDFVAGSESNRSRI